MPEHDRVLVAIMPQLLDFGLARDQHWYRIPVAKAHTWVREQWPPNWLAFYLPKKFGLEAHAVTYFARVDGIREVARWDVLRFNTHQFNDEMASYCLPTIVDLVDCHGGLDVGDLRGWPMPSAPKRLRQLGLFDALD